MSARPPFDEVIVNIAQYVCQQKIDSELAYETAKLCLLDTLGCGLLALSYPACSKLLGPVVPGASLRNGARVPGTDFELEPVQAAFNIGAMIRWLDFNDTWLAAEWGHPSDNLGGLLAVADYLNRNSSTRKYSLKDLFTFMIKAHEIQGVLALENSFNRMGLDHVILVKVATTALVTYMLGGDQQKVMNAVSNAFLDGQSLRAYRHAPNTGPRKSWAAGDATSRGVRLALLAMRGEMGYPTCLTEKIWGFYDVYAKGESFTVNQTYGSYVMENVLFKVCYPAEFHSQTAVEAALALHQLVKDKWDEIATIHIETQEAAMRIINKTGPLHNPADRDHCLQYIVAIALLFGELTAQHYEDKVAADPRIDALRAKMQVTENKQFSIDYLDPGKRSIGNSVQILFKDGTKSDKVTIEYPIGHKTRRQESKPLLIDKFRDNAGARFDKKRVDELLACFSDPALVLMPVDEFVGLFI